MADPLTFGGEERFDVAPVRLYHTLTDLDCVARGIPDLVSHERVNDKTLRCVVRPGFAFLRGTMKLTVMVEPTEPPIHARMRSEAQGIGVGMVIESQMEVQPDGSGSRLVWTARVAKMSGLVATISPGLIRAAAEQTIDRSWKALRAQLAADNVA